MDLAGASPIGLSGKGAAFWVIHLLTMLLYFRRALMGRWGEEKTQVGWKNVVLFVVFALFWGRVDH